MKKDYEKIELMEVVKKSKTYREVLIYFNRNESSSSYKTLHKKIKEWGIDISHFLSKSEHTKMMYKVGLLDKKNSLDLFVENCKFGRSTIKKRIIDENLIDYKCCMCDNNGEWMGNKVSLILDHINGINNDNRLENLRFLCPNCNATLKTHCVGSIGLIDKTPNNRKIPNRVHLRIVNRPSYDILIKEINEFGYCWVGRKYGVSDNAIRKWVKFYEKTRQ
jgi:hypothetical protein